MSIWIRNLRLALEHKNVILLHCNVRDTYIDSQGQIFNNLTSLLESIARRPAESGSSRQCYHEFLIADPTGEHDFRGRERRIQLQAVQNLRRAADNPPHGAEAEGAGLGRRREDPTGGLNSEPPHDRGSAGGTVPTRRILARWRQELSATDTNRFAVLFYVDKLAPYQATYGQEDREIVVRLEKLIENIGPNHRLVLVALQDSMVPVELYTHSPKCRVLAIPVPDTIDRDRFLETMIPAMPIERRQMVANLTEGMYLSELRSVVPHMEANPLAGERDLRRVINSYRIGIEKDYWGEVSLEKLQGAFNWFTREEGVKGQDEAVRHVVNVLFRARAGLSGLASGTSAKPKGVLFFAGPSGTGKTLLAKKLARFLFGSEEAFLRIDMSELMEEHSVSKLIGSPPGYIGSERGGMLTSAVGERPFSVVLFDEIEKAHTKILDVFLQVFDEGRLTDSRGQTVYFTETIIILTSNVGCRSTDSSPDRRPCGERQQWDRIRDDTTLPDKERRVALRNHFVESARRFFVTELSRPELLNRIGSNIIPFNSIDGVDVQREIIDSHIKRIQETFCDQRRLSGDRLTINESVPTYLLAKFGDSMAEFGGRGITNTIEDEIIRVLAHSVLIAERNQMSQVDFRITAEGGTLHVDLV